MKAAVLARSVSGRRAWGAEDDHPVARADLGESSDIGRAVGMRREDALDRPLRPGRVRN
jgi:hypothetical protein